VRELAATGCAFNASDSIGFDVDIPANTTTASTVDSLAYCVIDADNYVQL